MMLWSIAIFRIVIALYQSISVSILGYRGYEHIVQLTLYRDIGRGMLILCIGVWHYKQILPFIKKRKYPLIYTATTMLVTIGVSRRQMIERYNILIGIKYGLMYIRIILSAAFIGHIMTNQQIQKITQRLPKAIISIMIGGAIRQIAKYIRPDIFYHIGYGPIGDFVFGQEPPIYYRTGPGGDPRLQGLFAGPNNYGYFLLAFFPLLIQYSKQQIQKGKTYQGITYIAIAIASILLTLSRATYIGAMLGAIVIYRKQIKQNKIYILSIIVISIVSIGGLSIRKRSSTQEHIEKKLTSIEYIIDKPLGYGLGTSGPAIHHQGKILPENYYIQMAIDTGSIGFILLMISLTSIIYMSKNQQRDGPGHSLTIGFVGLLVIGLFLHVFEDSMVNYLFFIVRGIYAGHQNKQRG